MTDTKTKTIIGWVLSGLLATVLIGLSARSKFTEWEGKAEEFAKGGFTPELMFKIGIVEVLCTILFLIPRTAFLGAILLTGYLGGAVCTHVRIGEGFIPQVIFGIVVWVALGLRNAKIFAMAMGK
jgi:uncharacterized membrane protein YphA (DoxX/SURF4 family)